MTAIVERWEEVLAGQLASGAAGLVDVRAGKKRWRFWVEGGALVCTRSNLKGEQADAVLAKRADLSPLAVARNVALLQLRGALRGAESFEWSAGTEPEDRQDLGGMALLHKALSSARGVDELRAAAEPLLDAVLRATGDAAALKLPPALGAWLAKARGPGLAFVAGGPGSEEERLAALLIARAAGVVAVEAAAPAPPARPAPAPAPASLDIDALLADLSPSGGPAGGAPGPAPAPAPNPWAPDKVLLPPAAAPAGGPAVPPPADYEEAEIQAIGDQGPVTLDSSFFEALNRRPDREEVRRVGMVHSSAPVEPPEPPAEPPAPEPAPPARHPHEDELRADHARLMGAADHFAVLGLPWDAGFEAFRKAHLQLAQRLHPDRFADASPELQDLATEAFDKLRAAWEELGDDDRRGAYIDRVVHGKKSEDELAMAQVEQVWAAEAEFKRGLAAFHAGRTRQAHDLFAAASEKVPDELEFRAYLGFTTFSLHHKTDAEKAEAGKEMLKEVLDKNKDQQRKLDGAWVLLGRVYRDTDNEAAARKCFVQALKLNPANADATREMRRLSGAAPGQPAKREDDKKPGFFARLFGKK
jgi:hypothetical protein